MISITQAADRLEQGIRYHDLFGACLDESPIYIVPHDTLYKLPYSHGGESGQFSLGDLRAILEYLKHQGVVE